MIGQGQGNGVWTKWKYQKSDKERETMHNCNDNCTGVIKRIWANSRMNQCAMKMIKFKKSKSSLRNFLDAIK